MTSKKKSWLMTPSQIAAELRLFKKGYFGPDGHIFNRPHGAGYYLYGVEFHPRRGWLAFEFDENEFDACDVEQHSQAIASWKAGFSSVSLPKHYFALDSDTVKKVFENGLRKWGEDWIVDIDLPSVEMALQGTIFGEQRYC